MIAERRSMDTQATIKIFSDLADRWLELSAQATDRAAKAKKGSPFALYESITSEILTVSSQELRGSVAELGTGGIDELTRRIKVLLDDWTFRSEDAKEKSAKTSLDGARHVGTALGLDMVIAQLKQVIETHHIAIG